MRALIQRKRERGSAFPLIRVTAVAMPENLPELWDFHAYWRDQGVDMVEFQTFAAINPIGVNLRPHIADHPAFMHVEGFLSAARFYRRMSVGADGAVSPCCVSYGFSPDLTLGNATKSDQTLLDMWRGQRMQRSAASTRAMKDRSTSRPALSASTSSMC